MSDKELTDFLKGKTEYTLDLFRFFIEEFNKIVPIEVVALKSMIAIRENKNRLRYSAWKKLHPHCISLQSTI